MSHQLAFHELTFREPALLTAKLCDRAWQIVRTSVLQAYAVGLTNKFAGTLVVLSPLDGEVLYLVRVDNGHPDRGRHDANALAKAKLSWRTKLSSREVQESAPHLLAVGDTKWGGSVFRHGLAVGFSAVQAVYDEMIAGWTADTVIAMCRDLMTMPGGVMESDSSFLLSYGAQLDIVGAHVEQQMAAGLD